MSNQTETIIVAELQNQARLLFATVVNFITKNRHFVHKNGNDRLEFVVAIESTPDGVVEAVKERLKQSGIDVYHYWAFAESPFPAQYELRIEFPLDWIDRLIADVNLTQPYDLWFTDQSSTATARKANDASTEAYSWFAKLISFLTDHKYWVGKNDYDRLEFDVPVEAAPAEVIDTVRERLKRSGIDLYTYYEWTRPVGHRARIVFPFNWIERLIANVAQSEPSESLWSL